MMRTIKQQIPEVLPSPTRAPTPTSTNPRFLASIPSSTVSLPATAAIATGIQRIAKNPRLKTGYIIALRSSPTGIPERAIKTLANDPSKENLTARSQGY